MVCRYYTVCKYKPFFQKDVTQICVVCKKARKHFVIFGPIYDFDRKSTETFFCLSNNSCREYYHQIAA